MSVGHANRYFVDAKGWRYCWTTAGLTNGRFRRVHLPPDRSRCTYRPGQAVWALTKELSNVKRSSAKARAVKWLRAAERRRARPKPLTVMGERP